MPDRIFLLRLCHGLMVALRRNNPMKQVSFFSGFGQVEKLYSVSHR